MIVAKDHYCDALVPAVQRLKFDFVGHDQIVLHERDIRRQSGQFAFLQVSAELRERFMERMSALVADAEIEFACAIIDKAKLQERYRDPWSPYDLALLFCMEKAAKLLQKRDVAETEVNVVFEARGATEDQHLELEFRRIAAGFARIGSPSAVLRSFTWTPLFADKRSNSAGLQIADLTARPLGLSHLRPGQPNRAVDVLRRKLAFPHPKVFP